MSLRHMTKLWLMPVARMWKDSDYPSEHQRNEVPLAAQVGGSLNPDWVAWLMGWPIRWESLEPITELAMVRLADGTGYSADRQRR